MKLHRRELVKILGVSGLTLPALGAQAKPRVFSERQAELLRTLCELIVPAGDGSGGAIKAGAPEFIDLLASENKEYRRRLTGGMTWLDAACRDRFGEAFLDCPDAQRKEMLDLIAFRRNAEVDPSLRQGVAFFAFLRDMTLDGYFTSRAGIRYLGFSGNRPVAEFPGCPKPEDE